MNRYHFADESGDAGMDLARGSSRFFIVAMVELPNFGDIAQLSAIRQKWKKPSGHEFKFHKTRAHSRIEFFGGVQTLDFKIRILICDKLNLPSHASVAQKSGNDLMADCLSQLSLNRSKEPIENDFLIVDAATPQLVKLMKREISILRCTMNRSRPFKKITGMDSSHCDGLQLADMIAGAMKEYAELNNIALFATFKSKIVDLLWIK